MRIWVEDNGVSIDPKYQHRLFQMFERIHPNFSYEGTVGVESDGLTRCKFWMQLPQQPYA